MPQNTKTITAEGFSAPVLQAIAYGALQQLNWTIKYAGENMLVGYTPKKWNQYSNEITVSTEENQLTVTSKMIHGESFDVTGRTKKQTTEFLNAFESVKSSAGESSINEWNQRIASLKSETIEVAEQEVKEAQQVDQVMNFSKGGNQITYGIIAINVVVFLLMAFNGVNVMTPTTLDIIKWGANFGPLTLTGDWWRLISCVFIHIGIIHLVFNMYALLMVGVYLEPMLGKVRYITAYLCTGIFASLVSLWWHSTPVASAGASGAIFGMYGVFLALLSTNLIPKQARDSLLKSIGIFIVYNLAYGMRSGVDNSAHIGGLIGGLIIGYSFFPGLKVVTKPIAPIIAILAIVTIGIAGVYLQQNKLAHETRTLSTQEFNDAPKYDAQLARFSEAERKALAPFGDASKDLTMFAEQLRNVSLPEWDTAAEAVQRMKTYKVSDKAIHQAELFEKYVELRKEETRLRIQILTTNDTTGNTALMNVSDQLKGIINDLKDLNKH